MKGVGVQQRLASKRGVAATKERVGLAEAVVRGQWTDWGEVLGGSGSGIWIAEGARRLSRALIKGEMVLGYLIS